jgi:hypothetical protein
LSGCEAKYGAGEGEEVDEKEEFWGMEGEPQEEGEVIACCNSSLFFFFVSEVSDGGFTLEEEPDGGVRGISLVFSTAVLGAEVVEEAE